jgi:preprotein translocase subunit SecD
MHRLAHVVAVGAILLVGCGARSSDTPHEELSFYIVRPEQIEDGRFIDTPNFPHLGFISASPGLVVTSLASLDKDQYGYHIEMHAADGEKFATFTAAATGKQILVMLGDTPLVAARVLSAMPTGQFQLTLDTDVDTQQVQHGLRNLVQ